MTETAAYDFNTGAQTSSTDFNGLTTTTAYNAVVRPTLISAPTGATTGISYDDANLTATSTSKLADGTTIVGETSQTINGRGQPVYSKYLAGTSNWNATSAKYDAMGRKWKTSMPYDSASSPSYWTEFTYDNLSRLTQTTAPDGSTSKAFFDETSRPDSASSTAGNTVRSQDAWGRERWARTDAFGRLVEVVEPNPTGNGLISTSGTLATTYAYDELDQLDTVTQGSQTRSFKYDSLGRLTMQKLAEQTATINDSGTYVGAGGTGANWSDAFTYDARSNVTQRIDARGVKTNYSYLISGSADPLNRLQGISYDTSSADTTYTIDTAPAVSVSYMATGDQTRVFQVSTSGVATEQNSYDSEGRISDYSLTLASRTSYPMTTSYSYDDANRLTQVTYPARYGVTGSPRKAVAPSYDQASRLTQMNVDGTTRLSNVSYNAASQLTALSLGYTTSTGVAFYNETYGYDAQTGLLTGQTVVKGYRAPFLSYTTLMDLSYDYGRGSSNGTLSGKTGQLTSISDNLDHNKDRLYEFDALARLKGAKPVRRRELRASRQTGHKVIVTTAMVTRPV
jgi:YD repeat-containing protein